MGRCEHGVSTVANERCFECFPLTPDDFDLIRRVSDEELLQLSRSTTGRAHDAILDLIDLRILINMLR